MNLEKLKDVLNPNAKKVSLFLPISFLGFVLELPTKIGWAGAESSELAIMEETVVLIQTLNYGQVALWVVFWYLISCSIVLVYRR